MADSVWLPLDCSPAELVVLPGKNTGGYPQGSSQPSRNEKLFIGLISFAISNYNSKCPSKKRGEKIYVSLKYYILDMESGNMTVLNLKMDCIKDKRLNKKMRIHTSSACWKKTYKTTWKVGEWNWLGKGRKIIFRSQMTVQFGLIWVWCLRQSFHSQLKSTEISHLSKQSFIWQTEVLILEQKIWFEDEKKRGRFLK